MIVGLLLQWQVGAFPFALLRWPVNIATSGLMIVVLLLSATKRTSAFYRWFSGVPMAVTLTGIFVVLGIVMGLTPQVVAEPELAHWTDRLGLTQMTSSWYFVLIYFMILLSLGALIIRRLVDFRIRSYAFYLNHIGLWLLLFTAGMGTADIKRYVMYIQEGETEWRVYNDRKDVLELPIAIRLNDFHMEEYPPKLTIIDRNTGLIQPEEKPVYFSLDDTEQTGEINGWTVTVKSYIHEAVRNSDSTYHEVHMPGASPAALIEMYHPQKEIRKEGWVCAGNISQLYKVLNLDEQYCAALTRSEPKRFVSDIDVFMKDGREGHTLLEVNKPYKLEHWMLYQYGYDNEAGKLSTYSSIELVYDPWIVPVYIGILLLAGGSICMLWSGRKRKEASDDVE